MQRLVRHSLPIIVISGVVLFLPSLGNDFLADDVYQLAVLERVERVDDVGPLSIYTFEEGKPDRLGPVQGSLAPWWASKNYRQNFFRPVAGIFHLLDHALYGREPVGYHATNLLLWGMLLAMVMMVYRMLARDFKMSPVTVLLAGLLYAFDEAHVLNVAWLAHRYALVGTVFTLGAFLQYHRFRRDRRTRYLVAALLLGGLGLLSDEGAIALLFWVAAYEVCLVKDSLRIRLRSAAPVVVLVLVYLVAYKLMGYGCAGSGNYLDPFTNPLRFLQEGILVRLPFMVVGALTPVPAQLSFSYLTEGDMGLVFMAWGLGIAVVLLFVPLLRRNPVVRFMALGALLSLIPRVAAFSHNRLLLLPTIGTAWMLAAYVTSVFKEGTGSFVAIWFKRVVVVLIIGFHGIVSPLQALLATNYYKQEARREMAAALESEMPGPGETEDARVLLLSGSPVGIFYAGLRWLEGLPYPEAVWQITIGKGEFRFARTGPSSFSIRVLSGYFFDGVAPYNCTEELVFHPGERFRRGAMEVVIRNAKDGQIQEVEVSIDRPLDRPEVWLLIWDGKRYVRRQPPPWR